MKKIVYTSINIDIELKERLDLCAQKLDVDMIELLSVLCFKAGKYVCTETQCLETVEYQERGNNYEIVPVWFFAADHEYMHSNRLACKVSVSMLLSCAMVMFLDEIMEKGINQLEIALLRKIQNSYKKKSYSFRNFELNITKNDKFVEYIMKMRMEKT